MGYLITNKKDNDIQVSYRLFLPQLPHTTIPNLIPKKYGERFQQTMHHQDDQRTILRSHMDDGINNNFFWVKQKNL